MGEHTEHWQQPYAVRCEPGRTTRHAMAPARYAVLIVLLLGVYLPVWNPATALVSMRQVATTESERGACTVNACAPVANTFPPDGSAQTLPPGLAPVLNATLAAESAEDYAITPLASPDAATLHADNPAQQFATTFDTNGVHVAPVGATDAAGAASTADGAALSLHPTAIVTASGSIALAETSPVVTGSRVEYRRGNVTEWYVNGPRGLEQGFTLTSPPAGAAAFTLALTAGGEAPVRAEGDALVIGNLHYDGLTVTDAAGATLPAHLDLADGTIGIVVDATGAQWPVTIDPLISTTILTANDDVTNDLGNRFGKSIATATANGMTTVVVGAPFEAVGTNTSQGAAYVFTSTNGGAYTKQARLTCGCSTRSLIFGQSVAVTMSSSTTTIIVSTGSNIAVSNVAYIFTGSGTTYTQQTILTYPDSATDTGQSYFGYTIAAATDGSMTTIAVDAPSALANGIHPGKVYLFAGSGSSYPLQTTIVDSSPTSSESFGTGLALTSSGTTNVLVVGAPYKASIHNTAQGQAFVYTGSGSTYTTYVLNQPNLTGYDNGEFGTSVALATVNSVNTIAIGAVAQSGFKGATYVFTGSGSTYAATMLQDRSGSSNDAFGWSVSVQLAEGTTLVAVGAKSKNSYNPNLNGVMLFTKIGTSFVQTDLPETGGAVGSTYGYAVAIAAAPNGDPTIFGGAPHYSDNNPGRVVLSSWSAAASVQPTFGDGGQAVASPAGTYSGTPFHLAASVVDGLGNPLASTGVTFTVVPNGNTGGRFTASDPASTTLRVLTHDGTSGTVAGRTDAVSLFPSSTAGTFTVNAVADGTALATTYTLTIIPSAPVTTINAVIPPHAVSAVVPGAGTAPQTTTAAAPPGLSPAMVIIDPSATYAIHVNGSGFLSQALGTTASFQPAGGTAFQMDTVYVSANALLVYITGYNMLAGLSTDTTATITVHNPPSAAGRTDGGTSPPVNLVLAARRNAASGSTATTIGATSLLAAPGLLLVPAPSLLKDAGGAIPTGPVTGTAHGFVDSRGGQLVGQDGSSIISHDSGGIVSHDGGSIVSHDGGSVISNDGGTIVSHDGGSIASMGAAMPASSSASTSAPAPAPAPHSVQSNGSIAPHTVSSTTGDHLASTDKYGVIMPPPVASNGIPGTFTRTLSVDGIAAPITYTITNLNPHDGNPAAITALSRTSAATGGADFTLTVTGTGFIAGSVLAFGGVQLVTVVDSATQLHATVPAALLNYPGALGVLVINPDTNNAPTGGASLPATFTVTAPPTLTGLSLSVGSSAGGATVTFTGTNFLTGATVSFDGLAATNITVVNATTLTAVTPAHGAGVVNVVVTVSGVPLTLTQAYTYANIAPQPTKAPTSAPKPGVVGGQPTRAPAGPPIGANTPTPMAQPMRH